GRTEHFMDGSTIDLSDDLTFENYVRESVLTPQAKIVQGFGPQMNSYMGQVKQDHLQAIIAFMKSAKVAPAMTAKKGAAGGGTPAGNAPGGAPPSDKPGAALPKPEEKPAGAPAPSGTTPPAAPKPGG